MITQRNSDWENLSVLKNVKSGLNTLNTPTVCRTCSAALKQSTALSYSLLRLKSTPSPHWMSGSIVAEGCLRAAAMYISWTSLWMSLDNKRKSGTDLTWLCGMAHYWVSKCSCLAFGDYNAFTICHCFFIYGIQKQTNIIFYFLEESDSMCILHSVLIMNLLYFEKKEKKRQYCITLHIIRK